MELQNIYQNTEGEGPSSDLVTSPAEQVGDRTRELSDDQLKEAIDSYCSFLEEASKDELDSADRDNQTTGADYEAELAELRLEAQRRGI